MQKLHQSLDQQLGQLEAEHHQIGEDIIEVQRRIEILNEVMSWDLPEEEADQDLAKEELTPAPDSQDEVSLEELPLEDEFDKIAGVNGWQGSSVTGRWFGISGGI